MFGRMPLMAIPMLVLSLGLLAIVIAGLFGAPLWPFYEIGKIWGLH